MKRLLRDIAYITVGMPAALARVFIDTLFDKRISRLEGERRQNHRTSLPIISVTDEEIVSSLKSNGIFCTNIGDFFGGEYYKDIAKANAELLHFKESAYNSSRKGGGYHRVPRDLMLNHANLFKLGLNDRILDIAEKYFEAPPAYDGVSLTYTVADGKEMATRRWHRDAEDTQMIKIIIYCNDVGPEDGPFEIVKRPASIVHKMTKWNEAFDDKSFRANGFIENEADILSIVGPAGTMILVDTARYFHRGKPATRNDRKAIFFHYFRAHTRYPFYKQKTGFTRRQIMAITSEMGRRQQKTALWRYRRSIFTRTIPPQIMSALLCLASLCYNKDETIFFAL